MAAEYACDTGVPSMFQPQPIASPSQAWAIRAGMLLACTAWMALPRAEAHGLSEASKETMSEGGILEYI